MIELEHFDIVLGQWFGGLDNGLNLLIIQK